MRTLDATVANRIVNSDPEIARAIGYNLADGPIDFSECCRRPDHYIVMDNGVDGAAIFEWSSPGVWQSHSIFARTCRGRDAIGWGKAFIGEMFEEWGADQLWGQTPVTNRAAHVFNRKIGAKPAGEGIHFKVGPVFYFRVHKDEWTALSG